ncbi:MAG: CDP-alcohol phosphatidyltransferase family protein [candidate division Zixibacteria bacterium]
MRKFLTIPNLLSLSRVAITPFVGWALSREDDTGKLICLVLFSIAAITDALDGWAARKLNQVSRLGIALDPIADKIMAGVIIILLIIWRDFPIWLAAVIIGRDLVIMVAGLFLMRGRKIDLPSNLSGKYAFTSIAILLASYVIEFEFGIVFFTWLTLIFIAMSVFNYARVFLHVRSGKSPVRFEDKRLYKLGRIGFDLSVVAVYLTRLYLDMLK